MNDRISRMVERSKSLEILSEDKRFVPSSRRVNRRINKNRWSNDAIPKGKIEKYLLKELGQQEFNKYIFGRCDSELIEYVAELKAKYFSSRSPVYGGPRSIKSYR